ncbi:uncharacterized protein JN550_012888 [Neoarthrinium moseri]|uniref:uncharacterized protein n=1 Tax=Neoarthrinium moseri TaxID=1658444 RepID=UPI001FDBC06D|nr:uncharacterized protein JN550_012888 [Neoarthrinium moseri]KAI1858066.1 hypothetical protein JN550_012888 [Neoarthrinium moseri]
MEASYTVGHTNEDLSPFLQGPDRLAFRSPFPQHGGSSDFSAMLFSDLPQEIIQEILIAAVNVRGIKRATRLRYVSRSWNAAVMEAIFASRILDQGNPKYLFWQRNLAYRVMDRPGRLSRPLRIIRKVAEHLVAYRSPSGKSFTDDALRCCVFEICNVPLEMNWSGRDRDKWFMDSDHSMESIDQDDKQFKQALLAAAAWTNEIGLVRDILPSFQDCEYLICQDGQGRQDFGLIFGEPVDLAAYRGHDEVVRLLMNAITKGSEENGLFWGKILKNAAKGNHISTVKLVLKPEYNYWDPSLVAGLQATASLEIFQTLLPLAKDFLQVEPQRKPNHYHNKFLPSQLQLAARSGNVPMMEYLFYLGVKIPAKWPKSRNPVLEAAKHGHKDALICLLTKGFTLDQDSFDAAVRYGNPDIVQVALNNAGKRHSFTQALLSAVGRENQSVTRMLLSQETTDLDNEVRTQAWWTAKKMGLESMARMLKQVRVI